MIKKILTHWTFAFVTLFVLTFIGLKDPQVKEILRLKSFDLLLQSEKKEVSIDIGIITIDEKAIEKYGQWPWKRDVLANIITKLREAEVGIIVLPILFAEEDRLGGDAVLAETIRGNGVVIAQTGTNQINKNSVPRGVAKIGDPLPFLFEWKGMLGPIPILGENADGVGVVNTAPEIDGVIRRIPLIMKIGNETYPAMAIEVIRVATQAPSYQIKSGPSGIIAMRVPGFSTIETDPNARIWLRWNKEYETISLADIDQVGKWKGRTVIVAPTAEGLNSIVATPLGEKYMYEITANTLQTVLDGKQINRYDYSLFLELLISIVVGLLIVILTRFTPYWFVGIKMIGMYVATIYASYYLFHKYSILSDASWIIITITIVGFHSVFNRFILEFQLKQQIKKQFEKYLDPRQVAILQKNPEKIRLGGERKEMTFLFMDIVGFTPISEYYKNKDDPEGLVKLINEFLNEVSKIILKNGGMIDKFMGDCCMAVFGAPLDMKNHAEMAIKSCIEIEKKVKELKLLYKERGLPDINVGTGVNTGIAIVGNMGSETRFDYSVIGDAVNLAARLEATACRGDYKDYPTIYSSHTMKQLPKTIKSKKIGEIKVKGKEELIKIYTTVTNKTK
jgi:adenylate cyclase